MIQKQRIDMTFIPGRLSVPPQRKNPRRGDKIRRMEGIPIIRCILSGNGNIAAPATDTEKDRIIHAGIVLILDILQALRSPVIKSMLNTAHSSNPAENIYWVEVPIAPNSLTILVK